MNFLTEILLSEQHLETVTNSVQRWCAATRSEPESVSARTATSVAIELLSTSPAVTSEHLLELLLQRVPAAAER